MLNEKLQAQNPLESDNNLYAHINTLRNELEEKTDAMQYPNPNQWSNIEIQLKIPKSIENPNNLLSQINQNKKSSTPLIQ